MGIIGLWIFFDHDFDFDVGMVFILLLSGSNSSTKEILNHKYKIELASHSSSGDYLGPGTIYDDLVQVEYPCEACIFLG